MTDSHSKEKWSPKGTTMRRGGMTSFLFRRSETEGRQTSTCDSHELECSNVHRLADWRSGWRKASEEGLIDCLPSRFDPGGARLALLKSPITASLTRGANRIRSSLKLSNDNSGAKGDYRKELSSPENMVYLVQGPLGRLAPGQSTGECKYGDHYEADEALESMLDEISSSGKACTQFEEACEVKSAGSSSGDFSLHARRILGDSWNAGDGHTNPEDVWREIGRPPKQSLRVDGSVIVGTEKASTLVERRLKPVEEFAGEMPVLDNCRQGPPGDEFNGQNGCPNSTRPSIQGEQEQQVPISVAVETVAQLVDSNQLVDKEEPEEGLLVLEANNGSSDLHLNVEVTVRESEQGKRDIGREDCDRDDFNKEDEGEAAQEMDARGESSADEGDESFHLSGTSTEDMASKEDDIWSDEALISSQAKGFPPPISILANESHPGLPSHMPRTLWRSVKRHGRFVLQEMQARPREFFLATRENGRLRLQLIRPDSDPVLRIPDKTDDVHLGEAGIESSQLDEDGRHRITGEDGTPGEVFDRNVSGQEVSKQNVEKKLMNEKFGISTTVDAGQTADNNESETCSNIREAAPTGNSSGDQSRQDFQHAHCATTFGFDNTLNLLSPSKAFFQLAFTNIQPAVR